VTHPVVILLRGVNVGGRNKVPMADLRAILTAAGFTHVRTYIQSGNAVVVHPSGDPETTAAHARAAIATGFGLDIPALGIGLPELRGIVADNPFPEEPDHRRVHAFVLPTEPGPDTRQALADGQEAAAAKGARDAVAVVGRVAYLHTPDGFGSSDLARRLSSTRGPLRDGTARNWATMTTLLAMAEEHVTHP
jgi:uncharacterized protein (DUF1697 family)